MLYGAQNGKNTAFNCAGAVWYGGSGDRPNLTLKIAPQHVSQDK